MAAIYNNWDQVRRGPFSTTPKVGIERVYTDYNTNINSPVSTTLTTDLTNLATSCTTAINTINSSAAAYTDPTYGLVAGLNCRVMGEDIVVAKDTVCVSFFNSVFFLLVTIGTCSFAFLFALCCITCTGVRHYKNDQLKTRTINSTMGG